MTNNYSVESFYFGISIGEGLFGKVFHAKLKRKGLVVDDVAIKVMDKHQIVKMNRSKSVIKERNILTKLSKQENSKFIAELFLSFMDEEHLYLVQELVGGGDFGMLVEGREALVDISWRRFYLEQVLSAIEFIHSNNIVHGDLKPSNILLTSEGLVKIIDFGCAMELSQDSAFLSSVEFQGTADYVSPEVIRGGLLLHPFTIDLWSLGCLVSFSFLGQSPFHSSTEAITIQSVVDYANDECPICKPFKWTFPHPNVSANDLIQKLLHPSPEFRLGAADDVSNGKTYSSIRSHDFFSNVIDDEDESSESLHHTACVRTTFGVTQKIDTNVAVEEMTDGSLLGFDFFI